MRPLMLQYRSKPNLNFFSKANNVYECYLILYVICRIKPTAPLKRKKVISVRQKKTEPSPAVAPPTPSVQQETAPGPSGDHHIDLDSAVLPDKTETEKLARAAAAGKAAVLQSEEPNEPITREAIRNMVKQELFDDEGYILPNIAAMLADEKERNEPPPKLRPVGQTLTILNLEDNCDELYVTMKQSYKALKAMMQVNIPSLCTY